METILRCLILSLMSAASCQLFFEAIVPCRSWGKCHWLTHTAIPAFTTGSMFIALTPIPPYILQPVRLILVTAVIAQIYFQMSFTRNLILSVLYCVIYWSISTAVITAFYFFVDFRAVDEPLWQSVENLTEAVILLLMMLFHYRYKSRLRSLNDYHGTKLRLLPLLYLIILVAFNMLSPEETTANKFATLATVSSFAALGIVLFYFTMRMLEKEAALHRLQLGAERARSQIDMFHTMQRHYDQQRHFLHDYKNQLNCIQGLIDCGQITEASAYIARMTGSMRTQFGDINTNHAVVNIILNQKYQTARSLGLAMTFVINDLSGLTMLEEDLVTLLTNLLDNAIEACEESAGKDPAVSTVIQFKMILEDSQLVLAVRNPVIQPVPIRGSTISTSKKDPAHHGIGLSNVDLVVRKYGGTSSLKCEDGWFSFSALFPL